MFNFRSLSSRSFNKEIKSVVLVSNMNWQGMGQTNRQSWALSLREIYPEARILYLENLGWNPIPKKPVLSDDLSGIYIGRSWNLIPYAGRPWLHLGRMINGILTRSWTALFAPQWLATDLVVTFDPLSDPLLRRMNFGALIYDCLDLYSAQPQYSGRAQNKHKLWLAEKKIARRANLISASSAKLEERLRVHGKPTAFQPGSVLLPKRSHEHFEESDPDSGLSAVYVGALDPYKVDYEVFERILAIDPSLRLTIIGQLVMGKSTEATSGAAILGNHERIRLLPPEPRETLHELLESHDFGVVAMSHGEYSDHSFPLKVWDYLAAGLPVLSVGSKALESIETGIVTVGSASEISVAVFEKLKFMDSKNDLHKFAVDNDAVNRVRRILAELQNALELGS